MVLTCMDIETLYCLKKNTSIWNILQSMYYSTIKCLSAGTALPFRIRKLVLSQQPFCGTGKASIRYPVSSNISYSIWQQSELGGGVWGWGGGRKRAQLLLQSLVLWQIGQVQFPIFQQLGKLQFLHEVEDQTIICWMECANSNRTSVLSASAFPILMLLTRGDSGASSHTGFP